MASYNELNALIDAYINRNGVQAITGQILNGVLKAMVEQLGRGYTIMGAATPTTDPGTPDGPECYFASTVGTYTDFDGLQIVPGELALLCYTPTDGWTKATIYEGFQEVQATIDGNVGIPSVGVSYADGVLSFDFRNMKGNTGDAAGFGTIGADIAGGVGTPGVTVESSGPATAKNLQFHFTNLKGETGVTSVVATVDNTTGTPACTVSLVGQQLTLAFSGLKGAQGNTGVSADYPIAIINNLTTNDPASALSAAQGVVLQGEITQLEAKVDDLSTGKYYGYFATSADLPDDATVDGFAYVGTASPYTIYNLRGGVWTSSDITVNQSPIGNEEDIDQNEDGKLQFANRTYDANQPNGMGYKILRKDATFASQVTDTNTIYEIRYKFNLNTGTVNIPSGSVLRFIGGRVENGTLSGDRFKIESKTDCLSGVTFDADYKGKIHSMWFVPQDKLSKKNNLIDAAAYLQDWLNCGATNLYLDSGIYYTTVALTVSRPIVFEGEKGEVTQKQDYPENYWDNEAVILTDKEITLLTITLTNKGRTQFGFRTIGFSNIKKNPNNQYTPIIVLNLYNSSLWGNLIAPNIYGAVNNTIYNYIGLQINFFGTSYMGLITYEGVMDRLLRAIEINKDSGATGFNNLSIFRQVVSNCVQYIYAPELLAYASIESMMQLNQVESSFFNNTAFCEIAGAVYWNAMVADYGGSGSTWTARYLVRAGGKITILNGETPSAFVRADGSPLNYNAGNAARTVNTIETNSLASLLNSGYVSITSLVIEKNGVDVSSRFRTEQVIDLMCSNAYDTNIGANLSSSANTSLVLTLKVTSMVYVNKATLFAITDKYTNKSISIKYYKSNNTLIGEYTNAITGDSDILPLPQNPSDAHHATIVFSFDTLISANAYVPIPAIGIDSAFTTNNFGGTVFNTPKLNRVGMLTLPSESQPPTFELFDYKKKGRFDTDDASTTFKYLCTQRFLYSAVGGQSFKTIVNAQGKTFDFTVASYGQGNNPTFNIYGDSKDNPFDIAIVLNTSSADNPFVEFDVFIRRYTRWITFVITDMLQHSRYLEPGEVYIKTTAPTLVDVSTAKKVRSIGTIGATADRPVYPIAGDEFYDSDLKKKIIWNGTAWVNMDGTAL